MNVLKLCVAFSLFSVFFIQSSIIVRLAETKDLPFLQTFSKKIINEDFRDTIIQGYPASPVVENPELLNTYITNMIAAFASMFDEKQLQDIRQRLFVAVQDENAATIVGLCFSQQISENQAYIRYLIVDQDYRQQGIGSALLTATLDSYENITSCELKTFSHGNNKVQAFYEKHGFVSDNIPISLQRKYCEHSDTITFFLYHLDIKN